MPRFTNPQSALVSGETSSVTKFNSTIGDIYTDLNALDADFITVTASVTTLQSGTYNFTGDKSFASLTNIGLKRTDVTIASDTLSDPASMFLRVDTQAAAATDDLSTITAPSTNKLIFLTSTNNGRDVVVKHNVGNILLRGGLDCTLDTTNDLLVLAYDSVITKWREVGRSTSIKAILPSSALTIASGVITATGSRHTVDTEGAASTDDLDTINGGADGQLLIIQAANGARDVVVKHNTGNILLADDRDLTLTETDYCLTLVYVSSTSKWNEVARSVPRGGWKTVSAQTVSGVAAVSWGSTLITSSTRAIRVKGFEVKPATDGDFIALQYSTNNGSSYYTTAGDYRWGAVQPTENAGGYGGSATAANLGVTGAIGNAATEFGMFEFELQGHASSSLYKQYTTWANSINASGVNTTHVGGGHADVSAAAINNIKLLSSGGGNISGYFVLQVWED